MKRIRKYLMRLMYVLAIMLLTHESQSQITSSLGKKVVNIYPRTLSVGQIIQQISNESDLNFAFSESVIDVYQTVDLPAEGTLTVGKVMNEISAITGSSYSMDGNHIIMVREENLPKTYTISGQIKDAGTGEDLIGATVRIAQLNIGAITNVYGFYSLSVPEGSYDLVFSYVGFEPKTIAIDLNGNVLQNIELAESTSVLGEVVITAEKDQDYNVTSVEMSAVELDVEAVKKLPALFGEVDIIKTIQLLPGVKTVGEGSSGFYVRGGNLDQNLVLLDEAPVYNASHLLGFFSAFNPDAIKDMKLYKGAIPSIYGGRLSSVLDIRMKEGNSKKFAVSGGIGSLFSRLAIEAPMGKKGSFMLAGRRSYLDAMYKAFQAMQGSSVSSDEQFYYYDLNAKSNYRFNDKNRLFVSGYFGRDVIGITENEDAVKARIEWGNSTATVRWNHVFSPKLFSNLTYYYSNYDYFLDFEQDVIRYRWDSRLREHSLKADFGAYINPSNTLKFGLHVIRHKIHPGSIESIESGKLVQEFDIQSNESYESAVYLNNEQNLGEKLKLDYGLRVSLFQNIGPQKVFVLDENYTISDTVNHSSGIYNHEWNLEPRIGLRYQLNNSTSVKASYNRTTQYIQLASNGNFSSPFDIWFSTTEYVKPQLADQFTIGYFKNFMDNSLEFSGEIYYKDFKNAIDFKDHAELLLNDNLEGELRVGAGRAYGLELMLRKSTGRLTGWVSYTLSKAEKKIPTINNDNWYNAKHDKPHDVSVVASYDISARVSVGANFVYSSGGAVTFPTGRYIFKGAAVPIYSERNGERVPAYHRMDLSATVKSRKNKNRRFKGEWVFGIYNLYNRKNTFFINFKQDALNANQTYAEKNAVFSIVPSVTYNVKF